MKEKGTTNPGRSDESGNSGRPIGSLFARFLNWLIRGAEKAAKEKPLCGG